MSISTFMPPTRWRRTRSLGRYARQGSIKLRFAKPEHYGSSKAGQLRQWSTAHGHLRDSNIEPESFANWLPVIAAGWRAVELCCRAETVPNPALHRMAARRSGLAIRESV